MKTLVLALVPLVACGTYRHTNWGHLQQSARGFEFPRDVKTQTLHNGVVVALLPDDRTDLVSIDVRYTAGSAEDPVGREGMARLVEETLLETYGAAVGKSALTASGEVTLDHLHFSEVALPEQLEALLAVEGQRLATTCDQIDEKVYEAARATVAAQPVDAHAHDVAVAVWGKTHAFARAAGPVAIADTTREEMCKFLDGEYGTNRTIVVVTGHFDPDAVGKLVTADFGAIRRAATTVHVRVPLPAQESSTTTLDTTGGATAVVTLAAPPMGTPADTMLDLLMEKLMERIYQRGSGQPWFSAVQPERIGAGRAEAVAVTITVTDPAYLRDAAELVDDALTDWRVDESLHAVDVKALLRTRLYGSHDRFAERGAWLADHVQSSPRDVLLSDARDIEAIDLAAVSDWVTAAWDHGPRPVALLQPASTSTTAPSPTPTVWRMQVDPAEAARPIDVSSRTVPPLSDYTLANGMRVVIVPDVTSPQLDARVIFPIGDGGKAGVASLAPFLVEDSKDEYSDSDRKRLDWLDSIGVYTFSFALPSYTYFELVGPAVFGDWHVWRLWWWLDAGHYTRPDPERDAFRAAHYRARAATLVVAGQLAVPVIKQEVSDLFGTWPADPTAPAPVAPVLPPPGWRAHDDPKRNLEVTIAPIAAEDPSQRAAHLVLAQILNERGARWEERFGLGIRPAPDQLGAELTAIADVRDHLADHLDTFVRARRAALADELARDGGAEPAADRVQDAITHGLTLEQAANLATAVAQTTPDQVEKLAAALFPADQLSVTLTGPAAAIDALLATVPHGPVDRH